MEKKFESKIIRKDYVTCNEEIMKGPNETTQYYIGYDSQDRIVNEANSEFYEYDDQGRVKRMYICSLDRDPECKHPWIFDYFYDGKNLTKIDRTTTFSDRKETITFETFRYDKLNRLAIHTKVPNDTTVYLYAGNDTMKVKSFYSNWSNNADDKTTRTSRETTFTYDKSGHIISSTWIEGDFSMRNEYFYDDKGRVITERDTSLNAFGREPNTCCILYWTNYRYDERNRLLEEIHTTGSADHPEPNLQWKKTYEYNASPTETVLKE